MRRDVLGENAMGALLLDKMPNGGVPSAEGNGMALGMPGLRRAYKPDWCPSAHPAIPSFDNNDSYLSNPSLGGVEMIGGMVILRARSWKYICASAYKIDVAIHWGRAIVAANGIFHPT
jgi:hypothetical protein